MKFFRYFGSHAYETLTEQKMMVSRLSSFNDPFEFLYRAGGVMTIGKAKRYIKDREKSDIFFAQLRKTNPDIKTTKQFKAYMRENRSQLAQNLYDSFPEINIVQPDYRERMADKYFRICCFTKVDTDPFDEILMWSHYANKHYGVRIGFEWDIESKSPYFMKEIIYSKHRVGIDFTNGVNVEHVKNSLIEAIRTKSEGWRYEKEYRFFTLPDLCTDRVIEGRQFSFLDFKPEVIWSIDFGVKCPPEERERIARIARANYPHAKLRSANYHKTDFSLEYTDYK